MFRTFNRIVNYFKKETEPQTGCSLDQSTYYFIEVSLFSDLLFARKTIINIYMEILVCSSECESWNSSFCLGEEHQPGLVP